MSVNWPTPTVKLNIERDWMQRKTLAFDQVCFRSSVSYNMLWSLDNWVKQGMNCKKCFSTSRAHCCEKLFYCLDLVVSPLPLSIVVLLVVRIWHCFCWSGYYSSFMRCKIHTFLPIATKGNIQCLLFFSPTLLQVCSHHHMSRLWSSVHFLV